MATDPSVEKIRAAICLIQEIIENVERSQKAAVKSAVTRTSRFASESISK